MKLLQAMSAPNSMAQGQPLPPNVNTAEIFLPVIWTLEGLAVIVVVLRLLAASLVLHRISLTDYIMLASLCCALGNTVAVTIAAHYGLGRHIMYLTLDNIVESLKWEFIAEPIGIICPMLGRISFCIYLLRLVGTSRWQKWMLHACIWIGLVINGICLILVLAQCDRIQAIYDPRVQARCWSINVQLGSGYFQGASSAVIDLCLTILPTYIVWKLKLPQRIKVGLYFVLCLSIFASIATIVRTVELKSLGDRGDITYNIHNFLIWSTLENVVVISAASIPCVRPLFTGRKPHTIAGSNVPPNSAGYKTCGSIGTDLSSGGITRHTSVRQVSVTTPKV